MNWITGCLLVARQTVGQTMRGPRLFGLGLLAALPAIITFVVVGAAPHVRFHAFAGPTLFIVYQGLVPLLGLILGVSVLGDEVEGRTLTYLYTRPLPRPVFFVGRLFGLGAPFALILAMSVGAGTLLFARRIDLGPAQIWTTVWLAAGGFFVYLAIFAALRTFFRRALGIGFILAFMFEVAISKVPDSKIADYSIWRHLAVTFLHSMENFTIPRGIREMGLLASDPADSRFTLLAVFLVALALGMWRVQSREVRLPAAVA
ncbi:MAG: ABC transporter permease subunit [Planctomycetota bacterium]|nr:ABC transporter permease subunit [Planctomycetota bacterium]